MSILITGSTGKIGSQVVFKLAGNGVQLRAMTRSPEKASFPTGVEAVKGDLLDTTSVRQALKGVSTLFLLVPNAPDEITQAMTGLLDPVYKETIQGHAEVRETFRISKVGTVAGCYVADGLIRRDSQVRVKRGNEVIHTGKIEALKRFKNDASEVKNGVECGISLANFNGVQVGDIIEAFSMQRVAAEMPQPVAQ